MLELTLKGTLGERVDGSPLLPERLASMPLAELMSFPLVTATSRTIRIEDLFWVQWPAGPSDLVVIRGDCRCIDGLGHRMTGGTLIVDGHAGDRVGAQIRGGIIFVAGNAGDEVALGMRGGTIAIAGNCGDRLAGPLPGEPRGMRGGDLLIAGNVGARACHRMRRGTVWIAGDVGDYLAPQMIAGTILVEGRTSSNWGRGMRRGSLLFARAPDGESGASLSSSRNLELSFLPLVWSHLRTLQQELQVACGPLVQPKWPQRILPTTRWVERRIGDLATGGKGEILVLQRLSSITASTVAATEVPAIAMSDAIASTQRHD